MTQESPSRTIPDASLYRLSIYHCLITDWLLVGKREPITSKKLADALGLNDVTVRNDLSYLDKLPGKRGVGYDPVGLHRSISSLLGIENYVAIAVIGSIRVIDGLLSVFNAERFGFVPAAFFSENPEDIGAALNCQEIMPLEKIPEVLPPLGIKVAIVATHPNWVQKALELLAEAGVRGVLNVTPMVAPEVPKGMILHQRRLPCDLKSLVFKISSVSSENGIIRDDAIDFV